MCPIKGGDFHLDAKKGEVIPPKITIQHKEPIDMTRHQSSSASSVGVIVGIVLIVLAGVGTGYLLVKGSGTGDGKTKMASSSGKVMTEQGEVDKVVGLDDISDKDDAEGDLVEGGIDGEGSHHLERPGGPDQNVYLVSSMIDLDKYVGKKVRVWGETNNAQTAGWFMDVVKLEVIE